MNVRAKQVGAAIEDAGEDISLHVTKKDIGRAVRKEKRACALQKCLHRQFIVLDACVGKSMAFALVHVDLRLVYLRYVLSPEARQFLLDFDRGLPVKPGTYILRAPTGSYTLEAATKRGEKRPGRHQPKGGKITRRPRQLSKNVVTHLRVGI
jgi:hypothetical protein